MHFFNFELLLHLREFKCISKIESLLSIPHGSTEHDDMFLERQKMYIIVVFSYILQFHSSYRVLFGRLQGAIYPVWIPRLR